ncbi:homoserine dehydrogenase [Acidaminococcus sp. CAG:917]|nr:homoserine dehydrogenase [Acidaminococcus sp. CAG:917]
MKKVGVALLGLGTVGGGTYEILTKNREYFRETLGLDVEVKAVLEKNIDRAKQLGVDLKIVSTDIADVVKNPDISIVAEFFGGIEPARTFLLEALKAGKSIVTANKELFSKHWYELEAAAKQTGAGLYFEASCVGGVPIIRTIEEGMQSNKIEQIKGIINGTTNYILTAMSDEGADYAAALKRAQELGYAEFDPTADVEGFDATYKISILSTLAYHKRVPVEAVKREGISKVDAVDIQIGKELGYTMKLLALSKNVNGKIEARVAPVFVPTSHPLASVKGSFNAVYLHGDSVDDIMLYGRGAGALPTGSAIVSDILFAAKQSEAKRYPFAEKGKSDLKEFDTDFVSKYYIRLKAADEEGTLAKITHVLGKENINIESVLQKKPISSDNAPIVFVTDKTAESNIKKAVDEIKNLGAVKEVDALYRVEE